MRILTDRQIAEIQERVYQEARAFGEAREALLWERLVAAGLVDDELRQRLRAGPKGSKNKPKVQE